MEASRSQASFDLCRGTVVPRRDPDAWHFLVGTVRAGKRGWVDIVYHLLDKVGIVFPLVTPERIPLSLVEAWLTGVVRAMRENWGKSWLLLGLGQKTGGSRCRRIHGTIWDPRSCPIRATSHGSPASRVRRSEVTRSCRCWHFRTGRPSSIVGQRILTRRRPSDTVRFDASSRLFHKTKKLVEFVRIDIHHISEVNDILNAIPLAKLSFVSGS